MATLDGFLPGSADACARPTGSFNSKRIPRSSGDQPTVAPIHSARRMTLPRARLVAAAVVHHETSTWSPSVGGCQRHVGGLAVPHQVAQHLLQDAQDVQRAAWIAAAKARIESEFESKNQQITEATDQKTVQNAMEALQARDQYADKTQVRKEAAEDKATG